MQKKTPRFQSNILLLSLAWAIMVSCGLVSRVNDRQPTPAAVQVETAQLGIPTQPPAQPVETAAPSEAPAIATVEETAPPVAEPTLTEAPPAANATTSAAVSGGPLLKQGPWLLVATTEGIWALNEDGSGLIQLSDQKVLAPDRLQEAVSPNGRLVAFISGDKDGLHHLELNLLFLPEGKIEVITELTNASTEPAQDASMPDEKIEPVRAIIEQKSLAWSPDGKTLAFIGVQDGPSADLYSYSLNNKKITRLSDGPSQAYAVSWSPDGKYILNFGAEGFGTGAGFNGLGGWATTADGSKIITLFRGGNTPEFIGWVDNQSFLMQNWTPVCGATNLRMVDVENQTFTELVKGCFSSAAVSANGMILAVGDQNAELQGIYAFGPDNIERKQLSSESAGYIQYLPEDGSFVVYQNDQIVVYSNTGRLVAESPPASCKYGFGIHGFGALYAWTCAVGDTGVWANGMGVPISQLTSEAGWAPFWSPTNILYFFSEAGLNRAPFPNFSPQPVAQIEGEGPQMAWVR